VSVLAPALLTPHEPHRVQKQVPWHRFYANYRFSQEAVRCAAEVRFIQQDGVELSVLFSLLASDTSMPADTQAMLRLPSLSPVARNPIIAGFDGASRSSDRRLRALREVDARLGVAKRLAVLIDDRRAPLRQP